MTSSHNPETLTPDSERLAFLDKVDRRDKAIRIFEVAVLIALVLFNVYVGLRLQQIINQNQASTVAARQANIERQNEIKDYIKCVLLIRFDAAPETLTTREGVVHALDACADRQPPE